MSGQIQWRCPKCGEVNDVIIGNAPAVVTITGFLENDNEFVSSIEGELNKPCDIAKMDETVWCCPNCGAEFHELKSDQDTGKFISDNRIQPELTKGGDQCLDGLKH
jgi:predicted RNA-binding Zn-ribbon protein involved in translation (DUF1610 family)